MSKFGAKKKSQFGFVFPVAPKPCAVKDQSGIGTYKRIGTKRIEEEDIMKRAFALLLVLSMMFSLSACNTSDAPEEETADTPSGETIKMAAIYGFTGSGSQVATSCQNAIDLVVSNINETGIENFGGAKLEVVYGDNQSTENVARTTAERVLEDEDILFCIGAGSSALLIPMLPVTERLHVPVLTNNSGD